MSRSLSLISGSGLAPQYLVMLSDDQVVLLSVEVQDINKIHL